MPELPEVETIVAGLRRGVGDSSTILWRTILGAHLLWERTLAFPTPGEFMARLPGQRIEAIGRRGKYIIFSLTSDSLLIHLRMSGDLIVEPISEAMPPHHRLVLDLEGDLRLAFNDTRKFGRVWLVAEPDEILNGLGPEPLSDDFTAETLYGLLQAHHRQLKPLLLDQSFIAGLGNIYTDEALNLAKLHPLMHSNRLTHEQAQRLWFSIRQVLSNGIRRNGTSIDWVYRGGDYQRYLRVYRRTGEACPECGTLIQKIVVGQRGTHYCPVCQPIESFQD